MSSSEKVRGFGLRQCTSLLDRRKVLKPSRKSSFLSLCVIHIKQQLICLPCVCHLLECACQSMHGDATSFTGPLPVHLCCSDAIPEWQYHAQQ